MTKQKEIKVKYPTDRHHGPITEKQYIRKMEIVGKTLRETCKI